MMMEKGNALFLILIAVALFAALSYAVTSSGRSSGGIEKEQAKIDQAVMDNFMAAIQVGEQRLSITRGCDVIDYTSPPAQPSGGDKSCYLFHPDGGGVIWQDIGLDTCSEFGSLTELDVGESCGSLIYAGTSSGNRIYTTNADQSAGAVWSAADTVTNATSLTDGLANTNTIMGLSDTTYPAAGLCRALGEKWYLPAKQELDLLYNNRNVGDLSGTFISPPAYWSSSEDTASNSWRYYFGDGSQGSNPKANTRRVRCVRRD